MFYDNIKIAAWSDEFSKIAEEKQALLGTTVGAISAGEGHRGRGALYGLGLGNLYALAGLGLGAAARSPGLAQALMIGGGAAGGIHGGSLAKRHGKAARKKLLKELKRELRKK